MKEAWLLREGEVLAALEVTESREERMVGLLNRDGIDGAILIRPARSVHSVGMAFSLDVAFCTKDLRGAADDPPAARPHDPALPPGRVRHRGGAWRLRPLEPPGRGTVSRSGE